MKKVYLFTILALNFYLVPFAHAAIITDPYVSAGSVAVHASSSEGALFFDLGAQSNPTPATWYYAVKDLYLNGASCLNARLNFYNSNAAYSAFSDELVLINVNDNRVVGIDQPVPYQTSSSGTILSTDYATGTFTLSLTGSNNHLLVGIVCSNHSGVSTWRANAGSISGYFLGSGNPIWTGAPKICIYTTSTDLGGCFSNDAPIVPDPTISLLIPSSSDTYPDRGWHFITQVENANTAISHNWTIGISYGHFLNASGTPIFTEFDSFGPIPSSAFGTTTQSAVVMTQNLSRFLPFYSSTVPFYAYARLYKDGIEVSSSSITTFYVSNSRYTPDLSLDTCVYPSGTRAWDPSTWGGGLAYGLCEFFNTNSIIVKGNTDFLGERLEDLKHDFPFRVVFDFANAAENAASSTSSTGSYDLTWRLPNGMTFPILTSSTLEKAVGSTTKSYVFNIQKNIIWLGAAIRVLFFVI